METICVCGAGTMGSGIAQVTAAAGYRTVLYELNGDVLQKAKDKLHADLEVLVGKQKISAEKREQILRQLSFTSNLADCTADIVIEAIVEKTEAKLQLFRQLAAINKANTIFASNTSSLSVSAIGAGLDAPERFAGLHFFNPAPLMKLVEVVQAEQTSEDVVQRLLAFTQSLGKVPVLCKDAPGFIVNRVARPFYIEALRLAEEGVDPATIDRLLEDRGFRMGPFRLMDLIGNDVNYAVSTSVWEQLGRPERLKPSPLQQQKVENGELGRKTGRGYFVY